MRKSGHGLETSAPDFAVSLDRLRTGAWSYAALATAIEVGLIELLAGEDVVEAGGIAGACRIEPGLADDLVGNLITLGAVRREGDLILPEPSFEALLTPEMRRILRAEVRSDHLQIRSLLNRLREGEEPSGWSEEDPVALSAQGETSGMIGLIVDAVLPALDGLAERMSAPGARILDVGAGVGVVSTELCRLWPEAEAVGLEPHRTARELGRSRIAAAGLSGRIALRDERVERLGERDAYDLAFLPQPFIPSDVLAEGLIRIREALRPGGWLLLLVNDLDRGSAPESSARRFRSRVWGGGSITDAKLAEVLRDSGFGAPRLDSPVGSFRLLSLRAEPFGNRTRLSPGTGSRLGSIPGLRFRES